MIGTKKPSKLEKRTLDKWYYLCYNYCIGLETYTQKGLKMNRVTTRVIEICPGEWVVQFEGGLGGWVTFSDTFNNKAGAQAFMQEQLDSADRRDE